MRTYQSTYVGWKPRAASHGLIIILRQELTAPGSFKLTARREDMATNGSTYLHTFFSTHPLLWLRRYLRRKTTLDQVVLPREEKRYRGRGKDEHINKNRSRKLPPLVRVNFMSINSVQKWFYKRKERKASLSRWVGFMLLLIDSESNRGAFAGGMGRTKLACIAALQFVIMSGIVKPSLLLISIYS